MEILNPSAPAGNFPWLDAGAIGMDSITRNRLAPILPESAEYLDASTKNGRSYQLLNILDCTDCIDEDESTWASLPTRARVRITHFVFRAERIPESSLFKASAAPRHLFITSGFLPEQRDFKTQYEALGLRGLAFREVWNDEGRPILRAGP